MIQLITIFVLVCIIIVIMYYNMMIHKKIDTYNNINNQIVGLNVLQDFMNTISEESSTSNKLNKINEILINRYDIKYSTIVVYNGAEFEIVASNVDKKHYDALKNLQNEEVFRDSIESTIPKYITVNGENERLPYQKLEFERAKSAMFFPLYIDNVYIGYWIIEGSLPHEFDGLDTTILEVVKNNIISVLKTIQTQSTLENTIRDDEYSELKSAEYLFSEGKKIIEKFTTSVVCLYKITNLVEINEKYSRKTGNNVITAICREIKKSLAANYIFVRYMGPKFAIVFSGAQEEGVQQFMTTVKETLEKMEIPTAEDYTGEPTTVSPTINVVMANYYKGTAIDGVTKELEKFLDNSDQNVITVL